VCDGVEASRAPLPAFDFFCLGNFNCPIGIKFPSFLWKNDVTHVVQERTRDCHDRRAQPRAHASVCIHNMASEALAKRVTH
jgi:hypothetical protein